MRTCFSTPTRRAACPERPLRLARNLARAVRFALALSLPAAPALGADGDEANGADRQSWTLLPVGGYSPETSLALGGLFVKLWRDAEDDDARPTTLAALALFTTRRQLIAEIQSNLVFADGAFGVWSKLEYQYFPDRFFGVGNETGVQGEAYSRDVLRARLWPQLRVFESVYAGVFAELHVFHGDYPEGSGFFDPARVPGLAGGPSVGVGGSLTWDTRDNALATLRGNLFELAIVPRSPVFGSRYTYLQTRLELRSFHAIWGAHVVALQVYGEVVSGGPPYYLLAQLGGPDLLRGYYRGRFRDRLLGALQVEYRSAFYGRFGGAVFGAVGRVASRLGDFDSGPWHPALGAGGRLALLSEERLNLRVDAAFGTDSMGIYVGVVEAF